MVASNNTKVLIGVDGGTTSTRCTISNLEGSILAREEGEPSRGLTSTSRPKQLNYALKSSISPAIHSLGGNIEIKAICLGVAGIKRGGQDPNFIRKTVQKIVKAKKIKLVGDMKIALRAASNKGLGVVVYGGTGSNCIGVNKNGDATKVGGWGPIIDDEGGGYKIGQRALMAAFRSYDARGKRTSLTEAIIDFLECSNLEEVCEEIYSRNKLPQTRIAELAKVVSRESQKGDEVAKNILEKSGEELAKLGITASQKVAFSPANANIYPTGGILTGVGIVQTIFQKIIQSELPTFSLKEPKFTPDIGALLMAAEELDMQVQKKFIKNLDSSLGL